MHCISDQTHGVQGRGMHARLLVPAIFSRPVKRFDQSMRASGFVLYALLLVLGAEADAKDKSMCASRRARQWPFSVGVAGSRSIAGETVGACEIVYVVRTQPDPISQVSSAEC